AWPSNRSPVIQAILLDGKKAAQNIHLKQGQTYPATATASDPDSDRLSYSWEIMEESGAQTIGGDRESVPKRLSGLIANGSERDMALKAPETAGAYRLFVYIFDGQGHAAHANIPFYVDSSSESARAAA